MRWCWLVVLLVVAAPVSAVARPAAAAAATFTFADEVSEEDRVYVTEGYRIAEDFFRTTFDAEFRQEVHFEAGPVPGAKARASTWAHEITLATNHRGWVESSPLWRTKLGVHESFQVLQFEWAQGRDRGPIWLVEGSAELVAWRALAARGIVVDGLIRDHWIRATQTGAAAGVPLTEMESLAMAQKVSCCLYEVTPLAVEALIAGPGVESLRTYFEAIGAGASWRTAFEEAFGQTVAAFSASFDTVRWELVPAGYDTTAVQSGTSFVEGAAEVVVLSVSSPIQRGAQFALVAATLPGISCTMDFTSANGAQLITVPTHAGPDGTVFFLWSVRERLARGTAGVTIDCGGTPVAVDVELT